MSLELRCLRAAAALLAGQVLLVLVGRPAPVAAALPALAVAGLAMVPALPLVLRANRTALVAAVVPVGVAVLSVAVIAWTAVGLPLTAATVLVLLAGLLAAGAAIALRRPGLAHERLALDPLALGGLALAVGLAFVLGLVENDALPATGTDWGKYLLYADEIRRQGALLIDNPVWLGGGLAFSEDPALPALHASLLLLSDAPAQGLAWGGLATVLLAVPATFAACAVLFGTRPAVFGALTVAILPMPFDMLAWHGAANLLGLVVLPLVVAAAARAADGDPDHRWAAWLGVLLVAVGATHRLTALLAVGTVVVLAGLALVGRSPKAVLRSAAIALAAAVVPAAFVLSDLARRSQESGGAQDFAAYLDTKVVWSIVVRDLTWPATIAAGLALVVVAVRGRRRAPSTWAGAALATVLLAYAYSWKLELPAYYIRAMYFAPLVFALLLAGAVATWRPRLTASVAGVALAGALTLAPPVIDDAATFYGSLEPPAALRGVDLLTANVRPGETVVTDRCLGFVSTWLVRRPIYAALRSSDIGPKVEVPRVMEARRVFAGGAAGLAAAQRIRARWVLADPTCPVEDQPLPAYFQPRYLSERVAVYSIEPALQPSRNAK